ncbi:MAG: methionine synthase [Methanomicrobiaceae archaeon]|uniref:5-methyltetrahydropteroyltriglutamate--homocysteine methyltransferase n=1 Tax=hydrocarbon metagenome TaxID=938273 RepID=A0A0W8FGE2_9ZZZZ|nr:methionine synthase [Methanomicrobiaceae archaeon]MDD5420002.1 methionine synthase [Methanomicrobiaceae archaeon]
MTLPDLLLPTTVIGSYPVVEKKGLLGFMDPLKGAVETAVADQIRAGIDIISDGQVRGDMIRAFTGKLPGIRGQAVVGKVLPPPAPITLADTKYALTRHPHVKGILTGPSTLAHALKLETRMYRDREEVALDLARALAFEARHLEAAGVAILQIDEPILSTGAANLQAGREAVDLITSTLRVPSCLHVCGDLGGVIDEILKIRVSIVDFEFAANPANLEILAAKDLGGRRVGYGCVDSSSPAVEDAALIRERILQGIEIFGPKTMLVDPDCGLRMLPREAAFLKLQHMAAAARELRAEYG